MIISASRRTDIPAFYAKWFIARIRESYCNVANPFNHNQVSHVSLAPTDVEAIIFWTRNPRPMLPYLDELVERGHRFIFQITLMDNPRLIDRYTPHLGTAIEAFRLLSQQVGDDRVVWRYDPILLSNMTPTGWHMETFERIAMALKGNTRRCIVSLYDHYGAAQRRLERLANKGLMLRDHDCPGREELGPLWRGIAEIAKGCGISVQSCAEPDDLSSYGIPPGACIDGAYLEQALGIHLPEAKDSNQRPLCRCAPSKDIGAYDTCLYGCQYCYATRSHSRAKNTYRRHDPTLPYLMP